MKSKFYIIFLLFSIIILYLSCTEKKDPLSVSTHPEGWTNAQSSDFHGKTVLESYANAENCQSCHGVDYSGGSSNVSCSAEGCHNLYPHPPGIGESFSDNFHSKVIANTYHWDITECQACHGADYDGEGYDKKNCLICHTETNGPEACNTCHGNTTNNAPPKDLSDNTNTTAIGVGAHQPHLVNNTLTTAYPKNCNLCHTEPNSLLAAGHLDNNPVQAEINFNASITSGSGESTPSWNHENATCSDVYCHGAFEFEKSDPGAWQFAYTGDKITGNNPQMTWTSVGTGQAACGSCHGLPPQGHIGASSCSPCHPRVVDANNNIINKNLHINGQKEVF